LEDVSVDEEIMPY